MVILSCDYASTFIWSEKKKGRKYQETWTIPTFPDTAYSIYLVFLAFRHLFFFPIKPAVIRPDCTTVLEISWSKRFWVLKLRFRGLTVSQCSDIDIGSYLPKGNILRKTYSGLVWTTFALTQSRKSKHSSFFIHTNIIVSALLYLLG